MDDHADIGTMLRQSAEDFIAGSQALSERSRHPGQPRFINKVIWRQMAELGWLGLALPESMGGSGMGIHEATALCHVFGRTLFAEPYLAAALLPASLLARAEGGLPRSDVTEMAAWLGGGERPFAVAWQETRGELEPAPPATRWTDGRLYGRKCFVHGVQDDSVLLVSALAGSEWVILAVDAQAAGVSISTMATAQGCVSNMDFSGVTPREGGPLLRGAPAQAALGQVLSFGRIAASAQLAGLARGCLDKTVAYVGQRVQFGHALGAFQTVAHRCVDLHIGVEMSEAGWRHAALAHSASSDDASFAAYAAKARCSDVAREVGRMAVQLHGAMGFTEEVDMGQYLRTAMQYAPWLGGATALRRDLVARGFALQEPTHAAV